MKLLNRKQVCWSGVLMVWAFGSGVGAQEADAPPEASFLFHNARVWTADPALPWADAVAIRGDKILAVGAWDDLKRLESPQTRVIDGLGGMITPGWFDSHIHLLAGGEQLASVQLRDVKTPAEFTKRIGEFAKRIEPAAWITGMDWDHTLWGGELPTREWIDEVTPDNPVFLQRLDGHMALANSAALRAAKIDDNVKDVPGGTIVRDAA
jgi:predicted amidohydrolase YtcJ